MTERKNTRISMKAVGAENSGSFLSLNPVTLLKPESDNGISVMKALKKRKTVREISEKDPFNLGDRSEGGSHLIPTVLPALLCGSEPFLLRYHWWRQGM